MGFPEKKIEFLIFAHGASMTKLSRENFTNKTYTFLDISKYRQIGSVKFKFLLVWNWKILIKNFQKLIFENFVINIKVAYCQNMITCKILLKLDNF